MGSAQEVQVKCRMCNYVKTVFSSSTIQQSGTHEKNRTFEINQRVTLLAHELGMGFTFLEKLSNIICIPIMHSKTYDSRRIQLSRSIVAEGYEGLVRARAAVRQAYK